MGVMWEHIIQYKKQQEENKLEAMRQQEKISP